MLPTVHDFRETYHELLSYTAKTTWPALQDNCLTKYDAMGSAVVAAGQCSEPLLPSCVPAVQIMQAKKLICQPAGHALATGAIHYLPANFSSSLCKPLRTHQTASFTRLPSSVRYFTLKSTPAWANKLWATAKAGNSSSMAPRPYL